MLVADIVSFPCPLWLIARQTLRKYSGLQLALDTQQPAQWVGLVCMYVAPGFSPSGKYFILDLLITVLSVLSPHFQ